MPSLLSRVIESQGQDVEISSIRDRVLSSTGDKGCAIHTDGSLRYMGWVTVPQLTDMYILGIWTDGPCGVNTTFVETLDGL